MVSCILMHRKHSFKNTTHFFVCIPHLKNNIIYFLRHQRWHLTFCMKCHQLKYFHIYFLCSEISKLISKSWLLTWVYFNLSLFSIFTFYAFFILYLLFSWKTALSTIVILWISIVLFRGNLLSELNLIFIYFSS